jgi:anti-sigma-K factor RskA
MKKTPERIEMLAAEYVLGTLHGGARRRFEQWMMEAGRVRQEVWYWEQQLSGLAEPTPAEQPPARVWKRIEQHLWPAPATTPVGSRLMAWLWPGWSLVATAAALVLAVMLVQQPEPDTGPGLAGAIVQENVTDPLWLISETPGDRRLRLRPVAATGPEAGKDYELWVVPEDGQPLSLGVMKLGDVYQITLDDDARDALSRSRTLAISLEPEGGSPTGAPTGPILHVTKLYSL